MRARTEICALLRRGRRHPRSLVMRRTLPLSVTLLASGIAGCTHTHSAAGTLAVATTVAPASVLHQDSRTLWSNQVTLTQQYVAAVFANDPHARVDLVQLTRSHEAI